MQDLIIVNASDLLSDAEVEATVVPQQTQIDRDFLPAWGNRAVPVKVHFAGIDDIPDLPSGCWPIFLNRHATDAGSLGWHDHDLVQNIPTYSRVFVGDCMRLGLQWQTTLSHEALEIILDPDIKRVWRMSDGRLAALEACDAVESDDQCYIIDGYQASNFVLPAYFSNVSRGPFDFCKRLLAHCPALTSGGYMSVTDRNGEWTQVTRDRADGLSGRRVILGGHRRQARSTIPLDSLELVEV